MKEHIKKLYDNDPNLIILNIHDKNIDDNDSIEIGKALKFNTNLQKLNIGSNKISNLNTISRVCFSLSKIK